MSGTATYYTYWKATLSQEEQLLSYRKLFYMAPYLLQNTFQETLTPFIDLAQLTASYYILNYMWLSH